MIDRPRDRQARLPIADTYLAAQARTPAHAPLSTFDTKLANQISEAELLR